MAQSQIGDAAGEAPADGSPVARTLAARALVVPRGVPHDSRADDTLLEAIRRGLVPVDPVARLLAAWPAPPVQAIAVTPALSGSPRPGAA